MYVVNLTFKNHGFRVEDYSLAHVLLAAMAIPCVLYAQPEQDFTCDG